MFNKEKVNTGRQPELDILKALIVVFGMTMVHAWDWDTTLFESTFTYFVNELGGGVYDAPIFMFAMGIGMKYSHRQSVHKALWRGIKLLTFGQVLNLARYALPFFIRAHFQGDSLGSSLQVLNFSSDIMQLAGLSFILVAITWKLKMTSGQTVILAMIMSIAGTMLEHVETGNYPLDQLLGLFWGTDTESFFPLFNWFIFIAAGQWFGRWYIRLENKKLFYCILVPVSAIATAIFYGIQMYTDSTIFGVVEVERFCWMQLQDAIMLIIMFGIPMGICYAISCILPKGTVKILSHPSYHINQYYNVSWFWIMMGSLVLGVTTNTGLILCWVVIVCLTILCVVVYDNFLQSQTERFCSNHSLSLTIIVWVVSLTIAGHAFATHTIYPNIFNNYLLSNYVG